MGGQEKSDRSMLAKLVRGVQIFCTAGRPDAQQDG